MSGNYRPRRRPAHRAAPRRQRGKGDARQADGAARPRGPGARVPRTRAAPPTTSWRRSATRGLRQPAAAQAARRARARRPRRRPGDRARLRHPARPGNLRRRARPRAATGRWTSSTRRCSTSSAWARTSCSAPASAPTPPSPPRSTWPSRWSARASPATSTPSCAASPPGTWTPGWTSSRPAPAADPDGYLAIRYSHPRWIVAAYRAALGEPQGRDAATELEAALAAGNDRPRVTMAAFPAGPPREEVMPADADPGRWSPYAFTLRSGDPAPLDRVRRGRRPRRGKPAGRDSPVPRPGHAATRPGRRRARALAGHVRGPWRQVPPALRPGPGAARHADRRRAPPPPRRPGQGRTDQGEPPHRLRVCRPLGEKRRMTREHRRHQGLREPNSR